MCVSGFLQRAADKADVVGCTAAASGLADDDCQMIGVIIAGEDSVHDLSDNDEGRVAGVVVYIFQSHIHGLPVVVRKHLDLITGSLECRLQKLEVDRRHLGAEDCVSLAHLLGKRHFLNRSRTDGTLGVFLLPHADSGEKRAHADAGCSEVIYFVDL